MRLLVDASVILDVLQNRTPSGKDASAVWKLCEAGLAEGFVSTLSFANLVYIMRRELGAKEIEKVCDRMSSIFEFADLTKDDLLNAAALHWSDFENALQSVTAKRLGADFIVTRNTSAFSASEIPACGPKEIVKKLLL